MPRRKPAYFKDEYGFTIKRIIRDQDHGIVDISTATTKNLVFYKPDGTTLVTKAMTFTTDGTDGSVYYVMEAAVIDTAGEWQMQVHIVLNTNVSDFRTPKEKFEVREKIA